MSFQAYIDAIIKQTSKTPEEIKDAMLKAHINLKDMKATDFISYLHDTYTLGRGYSMALWKYFIEHGWIQSKTSKIKTP